ncbi:neuropeptides capa receptor-like [Contarinia nasturtii]|uniref:neuropeptides capa receptor-like n=1 Tax=Contarinia nasturtii TaxID=265458 RepID=UPI0012D3F8DD|nr:neuropeptides capa receptor-like [Contarinia nasturtii]
MHDDIICFNGMDNCETDDAAAQILSTNTYTGTTTVMPSFYDRCDPSNLTSFNCTKEEFLFYSRGDDVASMWLTMPVTTSYTLILLAGIIGNLTVCSIIIRNRSMHTTTNYYLFNLAIADLLYLLLGLPFEIYMFWNQYPWPFSSEFCKCRTLLSDSCTYASVLTIVAFSVERYIAICHPLCSYVMDNLKRVVYVIALIWIFSFLSATPVALNRYVHFVRYPPPNGPEIPESGICTLDTSFKGLYEMSTLIFFVIPLVILIIMYTQIASKLNSREENRNNGQLGESSNAKTKTKHLKSKKRVIRMLHCIVVTFFISWAPFHAQRLVFIYGKDWNNYDQINEFLFTIAGVFYYMSCTINPIIYNVMSHRYRKAFRQTFCCQENGSQTTTQTQF